MLLGCYDKKSNHDYLFTTLVGNHLYVETFSVYKGGAQGGDIHSNYLTDSVNFRLFVGTHIDETIFYYHFDGDTIFIEETTRIVPRKTLSKKKYSLALLQKEKAFE
jgi:hypothetical protein